MRRRLSLALVASFGAHLGAGTLLLLEHVRDAPARPAPRDPPAIHPPKPIAERRAAGGGAPTKIVVTGDAPRPAAPLDERAPEDPPEAVTEAKAPAHEHRPEPARARPEPMLVRLVTIPRPELLAPVPAPAPPRAAARAPERLSERPRTNARSAPIAPEPAPPAPQRSPALLSTPTRAESPPALDRKSLEAWLAASTSLVVREARSPPPAKVVLPPPLPLPPATAEAAGPVVVMHPEHAPIDPTHPPPQAPRGASQGAGKSLGKTGDDGAAPADPLEIIRERIRQIIPLATPTEARRRGMRGTALVRFTLNAEGYCAAMQLLRSSGHAVLDREVVPILHLAEPYPRVDGWIVVPIEF